MKFSRYEIIDRLHLFYTQPIHLSLKILSKQKEMLAYQMEEDVRFAADCTEEKGSTSP